MISPSVIQERTADAACDGWHSGGSDKPFTETALLIDGFPQHFAHIDKVVILFDLKKDESLLNHWQAFIDVSEMKIARFPYLHSWTSSAEYYLEQAQRGTNVPGFRLVFNPNKLIPSQSFYMLIKNMKHQRFSQIDYAVDYYQDLSSCKFVTDISKKSTSIYSRSGKLETHYIGSRNSDDMYRIYDKAKESQLDGTLWRIEQQQRFSRDDDWKAHQPFKDLAVYHPSFESIPDIKDRAMLYYLEQHPSSWGDLNWRQRKKYKELNNSPWYVKQLDPHPYDLFLQRQDKLTAQLNSYLHPIY